MKGKKDSFSPSLSIPLAKAPILLSIYWGLSEQPTRQRRRLFDETI
jgi:hypothetical protein